MKRPSLRRVVGLVVLSFVLWPGLQDVLAQELRPISPEEAITVRRIADIDLSPDGAAVLYVVRQADLDHDAVHSAIWLHDVADGKDRQLTFTDASHSSPRWSPDGGSFAFLSDRGGSTAIWLMARAGGEARQLTEIDSDVNTFAFSPDGSRIAFTAAAPGSRAERRKERREGDAYVFQEPVGLPKLWLLDLVRGESEQLTRRELAIDELAWSPDGTRLAVAARPSSVLDFIGQTELYLVDALDGTMRQLSDNAAVEGGLAFSPDGARLLYTAPDAQRFVNAEAKLFELALEDATPRRLATSHVTGIDSPRIDATSVVRFLSGVDVTRGLYEVAADGGAVRPLFARDGTVSRFDAEGTRFAMIYSDATHLPELWIGDLEPEGVSAAPVTAINPGAASWLLGETRVENWRSTDGTPVQGILTLPVNYREGERAPLMVMIHGGPEAAHTLELDPGYIEYPQVLAGRGWAVLRVNYRGGTNYGDAFVQGMNGDSGGGDFQDIMTGVDHLIAAGIADPDRMGVMGWSWGGISTGWIVTQTERFKAASAGAMVSDHFSVFGQADLTFDVENFYIGGSPWLDPGKYLRHSPIGHVAGARTPTLLLHGEEDERCPLPQSVEFFKALRSLGVETQLVVYPREPHVFREPLHQLDKMTREIAWFDRHVLGRDN